jgi:TetR/AcrR family transcriptional regulator
MPARPGERRNQILQTLASMLEQPQPEKITTAALAEKLDVSEAALYRHFASKAQMYEGLIEFIEQTLFGMINKLSAEEPNALKQLDQVLALLLGFAQRNPGMTRVLIGEALIHEHERLQARINQMHDRIEASLRQLIRLGITQQEIPEGVDANIEANMLLCSVIGRWHQYAKSGFKRLPLDHWKAQRWA